MVALIKRGSGISSVDRVRPRLCWAPTVLTDSHCTIGLPLYCRAPTVLSGSRCTVGLPLYRSCCAVGLPLYRSCCTVGLPLYRSCCAVRLPLYRSCCTVGLPLYRSCCAVEFAVLPSLGLSHNSHFLPQVLPWSCPSLSAIFPFQIPIRNLTLKTLMLQHFQARSDAVHSILLFCPRPLTLPPHAAPSR